VSSASAVTYPFPLNVIVNVLVMLTLAVEVIRALMIRQINRLKVVPNISQYPGMLGMTNKICALHRRFFPDSQRAVVLRRLRTLQLVVFVIGAVMLLVEVQFVSRHQ
jgi:hypothetical protein